MSVRIAEQRNPNGRDVVMYVENGTVLLKK